MKALRWVPGLLALLLSCAPTGSPGGGYGPYLNDLSGGSRFAQDGRTGLLGTGGGTGPIHWRLIPADAGTVAVVQAWPAQGGASPASPQSASNSEVLVQLFPGHTQADIEASVDTGGVPPRSLTLKIVQDIQVRLPAERITLAPAAESWLESSVAHPTEPAYLLPRRVEWTWVGPYGDGLLQEQSGTSFLAWLQPVAWRLKAPTIPGTYTLRATAGADPAATALLTLDVR
jgi:hypothetical protein